MKTAIDKEIEEIQKQIEKLESWREYEKIAEQILADIGVENPYGYGSYYISAGVGAGKLNGVLVFVGAATKETVEEMLRRFRAVGFKSKKYDDYAEVSRRTYYLQRGDEKPIILLSALFSGESETACRYVECGEETVKKYKLVCPDGEPGAEGETA